MKTCTSRYRAVIKFLTKVEKHAKEIHRNMADVYCDILQWQRGHKNLSCQTCLRMWRFKYNYLQYNPCTFRHVKIIWQVGTKKLKHSRSNFRKCWKYFKSVHCQSRRISHMPCNRKPDVITVTQILKLCP